MGRHGQMPCRGQSLVRMLVSDLEQRGLGGASTGIDEVHDRTLVLAYNSGMRLGDEVSYGSRVPMVPASQTAPVVEALLDDSPLASRGQNEIMQVDLKPVGDGVVVDSGGKPARTDKGIAVEAVSFCNSSQFLRGISREAAAAPADIDAQLI